VKDLAGLRAVRKWSGGIATERSLLHVVLELRRLNRTITTPLERDLKLAGCPPLESFEVLRAIHESGDMQLTSADLQSRLTVPERRMSRLVDRLARDGYVKCERTTSGARNHFVVITDLGRDASIEASTVLSAAVRQFFYKKART
jgi:DNA-binding MarR family transcriptional regulator